VEEEVTPTVGRVNLVNKPREPDVLGAPTQEALEAGAVEEERAHPRTDPQEENLGKKARHLKEGLHSFKRDHLPHGEDGRSVEAVFAAEGVPFLLIVTETILVDSARHHADRLSVSERAKALGRQRRRGHQQIHVADEPAQVAFVEGRDQSRTGECTFDQLGEGVNAQYDRPPLLMGLSRVIERPRTDPL
jgi:hypothetical protein